MNDFPLSPFLARLQAERFAIGLDDYDRITRVLRTGETWTLARLRGVLRVLLAKSPEQAQIFDRVFDGYFARDLKLPPRIEVIEARTSVEAPPTDVEGSTIPEPILLSPRTKLARFRRAVAEKLARVFAVVKPVIEFLFAIALLAMIAVPLLSLRECRPTPVKTDRVDSTNAIRNTHPDLVSPKHNQPISAGTEIRFTWTAVDRATSYDFLDPGFDDQPFVIRGNISTNFTTFVINDEGTYQWKVRAHRRGLESTESDVRTFFITPGQSMWPYVIGAFFLLFGTSMLIGHVLVLLGRGVVPSADFDPIQPRLFPLESIGGRRPRYLGARDLDRAARLITTLVDEDESERLDLDDTVRETTRAAGMPILQYERRRIFRPLYILEDAYASPRAWNTIASELADGLALRNVVVRTGRFFGAPDRFEMSDGEMLTIRDLATRSEHLLLLLFSDGKHLRPRRDAASLDMLSQTDGVAWLELRDRQFWDAASELVAGHGIRMFPTTASGVYEAMSALLAPRATSGPAARRRRSIPPNARVEAQVEHILGEALSWAQACAMIHPIPIALAERLRTQFHSSLRPEVIDLLFRLPDSTWDVSGVRLSWPVLNVLRTGFAARRSVARQHEILRVITDEIRKVEPREKGSLAHLTWEWMLIRVRMELEPDRALAHVEKLLRTPLARHVRAELAHIGRPRAGADEGLVPLLRYPETAEARRVLHTIAPDAQRAIPQEERRLRNRLRRVHAPSRRQLVRNPAWVAWCEAAETLLDILMYFPFAPPVRREKELTP